MLMSLMGGFNVIALPCLSLVLISVYSNEVSESVEKAIKLGSLSLSLSAAAAVQRGEE